MTSQMLSSNVTCMQDTLNVLGIWISPGHDFRGQHGKGRLNHGVQRVDSITCVAGKGIQGDRYFEYKEDFKGQISFFSEEVAAGLEHELQLPPFERSHLRRNVLVSGIDLNGLIGKAFAVGGVEFSGSEECAPCYWMEEAIGPGAHEWLKGRGGLRCRILSSGLLGVGMQSLVVHPG